ncbi:MAG: hypothetical protein Q8P93_04015 [bacterium]|nr:hypothetical protein [bacterium]
MISLVHVIGTLIVLFTLFLILRTRTSFKVCALCAATTSTWVGLVVLWLRGVSIDPVIIALFVGGSIVGLLYVIEEKIPTHYLLFRVPYYISAIVLAYGVLGESMSMQRTIPLVVVVWLVAIVFFIFRTNARAKQYADMIIACCKNW